MTLNIAVLGSTNGTDLSAIVDAIQNDVLKDVNIAFVLSNKKDSGILKKARDNNIKDIFIAIKEREEFDREVDKLLEENDVGLVVLIGYMRLMSNWFVYKWRNKVMNIHPSLLPAFAGGMDLNVHEEVLNHGCRVSGATLMFIDEGTDTGPIILQESVPIYVDDTPKSLKDKVQKVEMKLLVEGIRLFRDGKLKVDGRKVHIEK